MLGMKDTIYIQICEYLYPKTSYRCYTQINKNCTVKTSRYFVQTHESRCLDQVDLTFQFCSTVQA